MDRFKIALFSDSHDNIKNVEIAVSISNKKKCTHLFHLGDIVAPLTAGILGKFQGEVTAVFGNCDGDKIELQRKFNQIGGRIEKPPLKFELGSKQFILMHEPYLLEEVIISGEADYIFFGHTHELYFKRTEKTVIINPGEISGIKNTPSFYILDINTDNFEKIDL